MPQESPTQRTPPNALMNTPSSMNEINTQSGAKPKRVRTGCLTCRERHLKCDEGVPICQNCNKSNRKCKRGVRLNFIDINCKRPYVVPPTHDWKVSFQDNSRDIASEYRGGIEKYALLEPSPKRRKMSPPEQLDYSYSHVQAPVISHQALQQQTYPSFSEAPNPMFATGSAQGYEDPMSHPMVYEQSRTAYEPNIMVPQGEESPLFLTDGEETFYMQVFVEEVGIWMDSMDSEKHFSQILPVQALRQPMLKHALLACGIRHLTLINPQYADEQAVSYYNQATKALLNTLQNPDRDTVLCATTATVLNVYEVMSEKALQRMNHIAGARALIKECRWDATSTGIGAACFWLNVGLEIHSCLHFNWGVAWDPDTWGIDMNMVPAPIGANDEEEWSHKILYILAKVTNFRSSVPRFKEQTAHAEQLRQHQRHQQWMSLKAYCEKWDSCVPATMHPMACVPAYMTRSKSAFPELWYIKRATIVARLFYHTAMAILGAVHPMADSNQQVAEEMLQLRSLHSRQICGIVAHIKDRGVASVSIRCLAAAAENLTVRREQEEVLDIYEKIKKEAGWRVDFIIDDLREKWGWRAQATPESSNGSIVHGPSSFYQHGSNNATMPTPVPSTKKKFPAGIINPLYKNADFSASDPPYQGNYVPPNLHNASAGMMHGMVPSGLGVQGQMQGQLQGQGHPGMAGMFGYGGIQAM